MQDSAVFKKISSDDKARSTKPAEKLAEEALALLKKKPSMPIYEAAERVGLNVKTLGRYFTKWEKAGIISSEERLRLTLSSRVKSIKKKTKYARIYSAKTIAEVAEALKRNQVDKAKTIQELSATVGEKKARRIFYDVFNDYLLKTVGVDGCAKQYLDWLATKPRDTYRYKEQESARLKRKRDTNEEFRKKELARLRSTKRDWKAIGKKRAEEQKKKMEADPEFREQVARERREAKRKKKITDATIKLIGQHAKKDSGIADKELFMRIAREIVVNRFAYTIADKFSIHELAVIGVRRKIFDYASRGNKVGGHSDLFGLLRNTNFYDTFGEKWASNSLKPYATYAGPPKTYVSEFGKGRIAESNAYTRAVDAALAEAMGNKQTKVPLRVTTRKVVHAKPRISARRIQPRRFVA